MSSPPDTPQSQRSAEPTERLRRLNLFATGLLRQRTLADLLWDIAGNVGGLMGFEDCVVYLVVGDRLEQCAAFGPKNPRAREILVPLAIPIGTGITGTVAATGRPELIPDTRLDPRYIVDQFHGLSELTVPIVYRDRVLALIDCECRRTDGFDEADLATLVQVATIAAPRIAHALEEEQRTLAEQRLARAHQELVVQVEERTRELRQTVDWLEQEIAVRRAVEETLVAERRWLAATLRALTEVVFAVDDDGAIRDLSDPAARLLGESRERLVGRSLVACYRPRRSDGGEAIDVARALSSVRDGVRRTPVLLIDAAGVEREFEQAVAALDPGAGSSGGRVVVLTEVGAQMRRRLQRLERDKHVALGELSAGVAQEVNDLLSRILGSVEIARSDAGDVRAVSDSLAGIREACRRGRMLTSQLLGFARGPAPRRRPIAVAALLEGMVSELPAEIAARVDLAIGDGLGEIAVDVAQIRGVVGELVLNACRAMEQDGRVRVRVHTVPREGARWLRIEVEDDGPGIPEADLPRIFEPCYTTRPDALGLGLATAHATVLRHDGQLDVRSQLGEGTCFGVELPFAKTGAVIDDRDPFATPRLRVLGIEPQPEARVAMRRLMRHLGHDVDVVPDAVGAVATFAGARDAERPFQVLVLDGTLACSATGRQLLANLREADPELRVLVVGGPDFEPTGPAARVERPLRASDVGRQLGRLFRST